MTRLTILRHGNTFAPGETPRRVGARTDLPLVESGRAQAEAVGRRFAADGMRFDRILASPLRRTRETAALVAAALAPAPAIEPVDWLKEIDHGPDEDRDDAAIEARIGRAALDAWDARAVPPPGWIVDPEARRAAWRALFASPGGDEVLIVTSNGAARFALLCDPVLEAQARTRSGLKIRTGAWGRIEVREGAPMLLEWDMRP